MMNQTMDADIAARRTPDGQERLATQLERDDVKRRIDTGPLAKPAPRVTAVTNTAMTLREAGDQVNRFLLCALVKESSRQIKETARRDGNPLPMSMIVRGVLRSYRIAASDKTGPLAGSAIDMAGLQELNKRVLSDETSRLALERVSYGRARLARAERVGDDERTRIARDELDLAISLTGGVAGPH